MRWVRLGVVAIAILVVAFVLTRGATAAGPAEYDWAAAAFIVLAFAVAWLAWDTQRSRRRVVLEASVPYLWVEPVDVKRGEDGRQFVGFRVALVGGKVAFGTQLLLRTMREPRAPISEPLDRSVEIPVLGPGQDQKLYVEMARLRAKGRPDKFATEWIHVTALARGPHNVTSQTSWEWHAAAPLDPLGSPGLGERWAFLRFTAREPGGRVIHDEKVPGYDWEPAT